MGRRVQASRRAGGALCVIAGLLVHGCRDAERTPFAMQAVHEDAELVDGRTIAADTLERGRRAYSRDCYACHGMDGDGRGPASHGIDPRPRDLRRGVFKFGRVAGGASLPTDQDLSRIVREGLAGTAMVGWDLPDADLASVIQFLKVFPSAADESTGTALPMLVAGPDRRRSDRPGPWVAAGAHRGVVGAPLVAPPDPWVGREAEAVAAGEAVYHLRTQCTTCHAVYVTRERLAALAVAWRETVPPNVRADLHRPVVRVAADNAFGVDVPAADFLATPLRSVRAGEAVADLYVRIAVGVGGDLMPPWLEAAELMARPGESGRELLYALAHYVAWLSRCRNTEAGRSLRHELDRDLGEQGL